MRAARAGAEEEGAAGGAARPWREGPAGGVGLGHRSSSSRRPSPSLPDLQVLAGRVKWGAECGQQGGGARQHTSFCRKMGLGAPGPPALPPDLSSPKREREGQGAGPRLAAAPRKPGHGGALQSGKGDGGHPQRQQAQLCLMPLHMEDTSSQGDRRHPERRSAPLSFLSHFQYYFPITTCRTLCFGEPKANIHSWGWLLGGWASDASSHLPRQGWEPGLGAWGAPGQKQTGIPHTSPRQRSLQLEAWCTCTHTQ